MFIVIERCDCNSKIDFNATYSSRPVVIIN